MNKEIINKLTEVILDGNVEEAIKISEEIVKTDMDPVEVIEKHLSPTMMKVGDKFENGEFFLTDLMLSAEAMKATTEILSSKISVQKTETEKRGVIVIGTVEGDIHDIGKNIVSLLLEINGFEVHDLGIEVQSLKFIEEAEKAKADVIAISALMSTTRTLQKEIIDLLVGFGKRDKYLIVVGGGATTKEWAEKIGADGWAEYAVNAPRVIKDLLKKRSV